MKLENPKSRKIHNEKFESERNETKKAWNEWEKEKPVLSLTDFKKKYKTNPGEKKAKISKKKKIVTSGEVKN